LSGTTCLKIQVKGTNTHATNMIHIHNKCTSSIKNVYTKSFVVGWVKGHPACIQTHTATSLIILSTGQLVSRDLPGKWEIV